MTVEQLLKASENSKYLILRHRHIIGHTIKMVARACLASPKSLNDLTVWQSFRKVEINEYINHKIGFI